MDLSPKASVTITGFDKPSIKWVFRTLILFTAAALLGLWIFQQNVKFILLLMLALLFAIAMEPAVSALAKRGWKRGAATGVVMLGLTLMASAFVALFGGVLFSQASSLISDLPTLVTKFTEWVSATFNQDVNPDTLIKELNIQPAQVAGWAGNFAGGFVGIITAIVGGLFQVLTLLLFSFYLAADAPRLRRTIGSMMSPSAQKVLVTTWDITVKKTGGFVISKLLMALASATAHSLFFAAIGLPYWLPLGLITGITSQFIPTVGTYIGILIPVLFAAFSDPISAVYIIIFALVYQQFENYLLSPRLSQLTMDIHPAVAFGSVIVFANLFGAVGAIVSVPIAAAMVALLDTYGRRYELIPELAEIEKAQGKKSKKDKLETES
jgi:predicted PurR-regulated permease PerM